jgi:phage shock protein PspC (stress-responsive transcriptional regulator)
MDKKLFRSNSNKMLAGVCGGIAEYFNIDPTLVRIGWALFVLLAGSGILVYIICALVIPMNNNN